MLDGKHFASGHVDGEVDTAVRSLSQRFTTNPFGDHCQKKVGSRLSGLGDSTDLDYPIAVHLRDSHGSSETSNESIVWRELKPTIMESIRNIQQLKQRERSEDNLSE